MKVSSRGLCNEESNYASFGGEFFCCFQLVTVTILMRLSCVGRNRPVGGISIPVVGGGVSGGGTNWVCTATWIDTKNNNIHRHGVGDGYVDLYQGCQARDKELVADVTVTRRETRRGSRTSTQVSGARCE